MREPSEISESEDNSLLDTAGSSGGGGGNGSGSGSAEVILPLIQAGWVDGFMCEPPSASSSATSGGISSFSAAPGVTPLQLPAWATHVAPGLNADPGAPSVRLVLSSPVEPEHHLDFRYALAARRTARTMF